MKNKKGLSDVITNVLIILLVVIAVSIIGYFVLPMITKSGEKIQSAEACLSVSLELVKCTLSDTLANVTVKRNPGEATLKELKLIFEKEDGSTSSSTETEVPEQLETKLYNNLDLGFSPKSVAVAAGIADAQGAVTYCTASQKLNCQ